MNLLIIGGLLVGGLLAIVGAVALARTERSATTATTGSGTPALPPTPIPPPERAASTTSALNTPSTPTIPVTPGAETITSRQSGSVLHDDNRYKLGRDATQYSARAEDTRLPASNGQFQELAVQLRALYQEVTDLERRLSSLSAIADHIECQNTESARTLLEDEQR